MTPTSFSFLLTLPCDAQFVPIVRGLAGQAVSYTEMSEALGAGFVERVAATASQALGAGPGEAECQVRFTCEAGELCVEVRDATVRQRLASA